MQAGEEARARAAASQRGDQDAQLERMQEQAQKQKEMEEQKRVMVRQVLEPEALERLHRVGLVKPEKQMQIEGVILNMVQSGPRRGASARTPSSSCPPIMFSCLFAST
ncbi:unnamed protein product [Prorocentrum cordatum]|uniref:Uncharacterized protein n=1 Tax=Prorocentrum cordatum TaxID=2364126 RepID=A0ABN9UJZ6_9DINO|nr:unnamed protein product [Polarella glacialis]